MDHLPQVPPKSLYLKDHKGGGVEGCTFPACPLPRLTGKQHCYFHFMYLFGGGRRRIRKPLPLTNRKRLGRALGQVMNAIPSTQLTHKEVGQLIIALQNIELGLRVCPSRRELAKPATESVS